MKFKSKTGVIYEVDQDVIDFAEKYGNDYVYGHSINGKAKNRVKWFNMKNMEILE